jgi:hypothetical protein
MGTATAMATATMAAITTVTGTMATGITTANTGMIIIAIGRLCCAPPAGCCGLRAVRSPFPINLSQTFLPYPWRLHRAQLPTRASASASGVLLIMPMINGWMK